jgi:hypothetical protein
MPPSAKEFKPGDLTADQLERVTQVIMPYLNNPIKEIIKQAEERLGEKIDGGQSVIIKEMRETAATVKQDLDDHKIETAQQIESLCDGQKKLAKAIGASKSTLDKGKGALLMITFIISLIGAIGWWFKR